MRRIVTRSQSAKNLWEYVIGKRFSPELIDLNTVVPEPDAFILHIISDAESLGRALLEAMQDERVVLAFVLEPVDAGVGRVQREVMRTFEGRAFHDFENVADFFQRNSDPVLA